MTGPFLWGCVTCNVCTNLLRLPTIPAKIFRSIVVTDSDTVVCGSNMLLRLAKYTVDMTRTMARLGILFRQLTNMDTISSPSSDQQPHNTNIHWIPASQGIALFSHRFKSLRSFFSSYFFFLLCSMVLLIQYWHCVLHKYDLLLYLWPSTVFKWCLASSFVRRH